MKQYTDLLQKVLEHGYDRMDRTGVGTRALFCETMRFDLADGFPAVTTKKLAFDQVKAELLGFIHGFQNNKDFESLGCKVWRANAEADYWKNNPNHNGQDGDLGRIYGAQWRDWIALVDAEDHKGMAIRYIDQLADVIERLKTNPADRRLIVSAWNPGELDRMALPPCHMMFQFFVRYDGEGGMILDMMMLQRSCDLFLGVPFNIASYALLQSMVAQVVGMKPGIFTHVLNDVHIYKNHFEQVREQLKRQPWKLPSLVLNTRRTSIDDFTMEDIELFDYHYHPAIKADMAV